MNVLHEHLEELTKNRDSLQNELDISERKLLEATVDADVLDSFINAVDEVTDRTHHNYEVGYGGDVRSVNLGFDIDYPYTKFPTAHLAEQLAKIYKFNGMLLAFKYCYDYDFDPDWSDDTEKVLIIYNAKMGRYSYVHSASWVYSAVAFSSDGIAEKCCSWLNTIDPKGELIL